MPQSPTIQPAQQQQISKTIPQGRGESSASQQRQNPISVFARGYIHTSKAANYTAQSTGYFCLGDAAAANAGKSTRKAIFSATASQAASPAPDGAFWQIIIQEIAEAFSETASLHNTLSDSISLFTTGAAPIEVTITGKLLVTSSEDHRLVFLQNYIEAFRARKVEQSQRMLTFVSQDTSYKLLIQSIALGDTTDFETYVDISIQGLGYRYQMQGSSEPLNYGYYGTTPGVPTKERFAEDAPQQEEPAKQEETQQQEDKKSDPEVKKTPAKNKEEPPKFTSASDFEPQFTSAADFEEPSTPKGPTWESTEHLREMGYAPNPVSEKAPDIASPKVYDMPQRSNPQVSQHSSTTWWELE